MLWGLYGLGIGSEARGYGDHMSYRLLDIRIAYIMAIGNWLHCYMVMGIGCMVIGYGNRSWVLIMGYMAIDYMDMGMGNMVIILGLFSWVLDLKLYNLNMLFKT
jgi:hypothetical protein